MMTNRLEAERPGDKQLFIFDGCDVLHEKCNSLSVCACVLSRCNSVCNYDYDNESWPVRSANKKRTLESA